MSKAQEKRQKKEEAIQYLRSILTPGSVVYTTVKQVAPSGMSRHISCYISKDGQIEDVTFYVGRACEYRQSDKTYGLVVSGCGMDMGFAVIYDLGRVLFPQGFKPSEAGRSHGRNRTSADAIDTDGGYALTQRWL